ncbi:MAG: hypothetical protein GTO45_22825 [Candidatus Aminicenantes bacterium]|nr:hypothetical protein [Candidatus Aminicenantes bacterium]NIM81598.1 hypothetical protein [Candidatus Aminicenantes bacterium]NIN20969.1 hypothetical protein [Candidatus Aminicenantes bacterium]NIN44790.1 hypothetical protein [Candidatus Aminicenantes bacterium]NIN87598.1 hypothetical protein [Candidatus Aminicenantes bacterium]
MRPKKLSKKLTLKKKTIAHLNDKQLDVIRGGAPTKGKTCNTCLTYCGESWEVPCVC